MAFFVVLTHRFGLGLKLGCDGPDADVGICLIQILTIQVLTVQILMVMVLLGS
jgi:hypothetical protein